MATEQRYCSADRPALVYQILLKHEQEGRHVGYDMEQFRCDFANEHLVDLLKALSPGQRCVLFKQFAVVELVGALTPDQRLEGLTPDQIEAYIQRYCHATNLRRREKQT